MIKPTKYFHLRAWDEMMGSYDYYKGLMQRQAHEEEAPNDAIWKDNKGRWHRASELHPGPIKDRIDMRAEQLKSECTVKCVA